MKHISLEKGFHSNTFEIKISLTKSGIPRILPNLFRKGIRDGSNPQIIKWVLTMCNLYRVLPYPGKLKLNTITDPWKGRIPKDLLSFIPLFLNLIMTEEYLFRWKPFVLSAKGSTESLIPHDITLTEKNKNTGQVRRKRAVKWKGGNSFSGFLSAICSMYIKTELWESLVWFFRECPSDEQEKNTKVYSSIVRLITAMNKLSRSKVAIAGNATVGRLAFKDEPGKIRVFAMVDCVTQWLLHSLHLWIFKILRSIQDKYGTDATFDQDKGVSHLQMLMKTNKLVFSYDLSAATDRLPISLQKSLLNNVSPDLGKHWANLLVNRDYELPLDKITNDYYDIRYATGQPMGALSSWGMLALTHHLIVQYSAYRIYGTISWFKLYLVLGDDIVILDKKVAKYYLRLMRILDVDINLSKSLTSSNGHCEFAKRFVNSDNDLSGLSLKEFTSLHTNWASVLNVIKKRSVSYAQFLRFIGYGSKSCGHFTWTWSPLWSAKRWFFEAYWLLNTDISENLKSLRDQFNYWVTATFREWEKFFNECKEYWKHFDSSFDMAFHYDKDIYPYITCDREIEGVRLLTNKWLDELILPFWLLACPRNEREQTATQLIRGGPYSKIQGEFDKVICGIFHKSPLWESLCFRRRENFVDKMLDFFWDRFPRALPEKKLPLLIKMLKDDPKNWVADYKNIKKIDLYCKDSMQVIQSEDPETQRIRNMKDFSKFTAMKQLFWFNKFNWYHPNGYFLGFVTYWNADLVVYANALFNHGPRSLKVTRIPLGKENINDGNNNYF
jgi:hypothetical protein